LDFESEKLEAPRNVRNPGLRLIERYAELFEYLHRSRQGVLRLGPSPTGHYPVICPSRELVPLPPHFLIKGSQQDIAQQWRDGSLNAKDNFAVEERSRNYRRRRAPFHPEGWVGGGLSAG